MIIKNCPACQIEPSCCTEWHLKNGEWKDCENINDCLLKRIVENLKQVAYAGQCDNCDGCGYYEGCGDTECGTYQALKSLELLAIQEVE